MKFYILRTLFIFSISFAAFERSNARQNSEPILIDEFGKVCSEDFSARYDAFANALYNEPQSHAFIIFYGDKSSEGTNLNFIKVLSYYGVVNRGLDKSRITIFRGENMNEMQTQFWLVRDKSKLPETGNAFQSEKIKTTSLFDKGYADFYQSEGKLEIYADGFSDLGCEFSPNVGEFAGSLLSDENLTGYLVIYGNKKARAEKIVKFAVDDLLKNHKIPRNRLKTIYGGKSEEPQIEFWFVPKNDKPPVVNSK